ncbi:SGNH/GDSL hydrolase family protein [Bacteroides thetaiotaomicron]|nr:SGNH/GDSL hydrolase family protein [Bacteroides thetaiotaomicron]MCS2687412.1 SGNH/GDSL hydrolase family protein [Bacteroides thetaiotaomicron]
MNRATDVGIKGLDLYCWEENGQWRFVSARPNGKQIKLPLSPICSLKKGNICYIFLSYDGLVSLSIGVDSLSSIDQPQINYPIREKPNVFYGTSIPQGGCASRPGMAHTNIISRRLETRMY